MAKVGVLLLNLGGPERIQDVGPFLYNLKDDPQEKNDVFASQQKVAREMQVALRRHIQRGGATPWQPPAATAR